jgi:hypothetical protein
MTKVINEMVIYVRVRMKCVFIYAELHKYVASHSCAINGKQGASCVCCLRNYNHKPFTSSFTREFYVCLADAFLCFHFRALKIFCFLK